MRAPPRSAACAAVAAAAAAAAAAWGAVVVRDAWDLIESWEDDAPSGPDAWPDVGVEEDPVEALWWAASPAMYPAFRSNADHRRALLRYAVPSRAVRGTGAAAAPLPGPCNETRRFARAAAMRPPGWLLLGTLRALRVIGLGKHTSSAVVNHPRVFLLGTERWRALLGPDLPTGRPARALDIGAGRDVLRRYRPLFAGGVVATELTWLQTLWLGWVEGAARAVWTATPSPDTVGSDFDVVLLLNVIDRAKDPAELLAAAARTLAPGGVAVVAVPLPVPPSTREPSWRTPGTGRLPIDGDTWADAARSFLMWLRALGWEPVRLSRVPYLTSGDGCGSCGLMPFFTLDVAVAVARPPATRDSR